MMPVVGLGLNESVFLVGDMFGNQIAGDAIIGGLFGLLLFIWLASRLGVGVQVMLMLGFALITSLAAYNFLPPGLEYGLLLIVSFVLFFMLLKFLT